MTYDVSKVWTPGLENDGKTLQDVYDTIPERPAFMNKCGNGASHSHDPQHSIPLFELECLHILLGRGFTLEDEVFVIGYWMGASQRASDLQVATCHVMSRIAEPGSDLFSENELKAYHLGYELGHKMSHGLLHRYSFRDNFDTTLGEIREILGIDKNQLPILGDRTEKMRSKNIKLAN